MAPNLLGSSALFLAEANPSDLKYQPAATTTTHATKKSSHSSHLTTGTDYYRWEIVWRNVFGMIYLHVFGTYGLYLLFTAAQWKTVLWTIFFAYFAGMGITAGAHRLWAHRCYKAKLPLRILLAICQTSAFQNHIYEWVRDHRVHHKFTDTDADPHNAKRGFFFSHVGWLLVKKHKDIRSRGKTVDLSDLLEDPVVRFQRKYYLILMPFFAFILPVLVPYYCWNEDIYVSWYACAIFRYTISLNFTWLVNSAAHIYGNKPYDKTIGPTENKYVAAVAFGEGWHNYHHVFPWDYKAAELGYHLNLSTRIIDWFAKYGWAYDLKTVPQEMIERRKKRTGDGSNVTERNVVVVASQEKNHPHNDGGGIWGWGDRDMDQEDVRQAHISHKV